MPLTILPPSDGDGATKLGMNKEWRARPRRKNQAQFVWDFYTKLWHDAPKSMHLKMGCWQWKIINADGSYAYMKFKRAKDLMAEVKAAAKRSKP